MSADSDATIVHLVERLRADPDGSGVVWSLDDDGAEVNVNLVRLEAEAEIATHVNREVDVVIIVVAGSGWLGLEGHTQTLTRSVLALLPKGTPRSVLAGPDGIAYVTVHRRRAPLGITGIPSRQR